MCVCVIFFLYQLNNQFGAIPCLSCEVRARGTFFSLLTIPYSIIYAIALVIFNLCALNIGAERSMCVCVCAVVHCVIVGRAHSHTHNNS